MDRVIGVKIYDYKNDISDLISQWHYLGINTAFVGEKLISKSSFRDLAERNDVNLFFILPVFHNPERLKKDPRLYAITGRGERAKEEWLNFVCPSRHMYRREIIENVKRLINEYHPRGISLDFIRHFVYWEKIAHGSKLDPLSTSCFDAICLKEFQRLNKLSIPKTLIGIPHKADWILSNCSREWTKWKCQLITKMVSDIVAAGKSVNQNILFNVHGVPWRKIDFGGAIKSVVGQDFAAISRYAEYLSPMCYSHMLRRNPTWINSVVNDFYQQSNSKIIPSVQVSEYYREDALSPREFIDCLAEALKPPSCGVVLWEWDMLERDSRKKDMLRTLI